MVKPDIADGTHGANGASNISPANGVTKYQEDSTVSGAKQAFKAWLGFQDAVQEMLKYSESLGKVEEILDRHNAIENATQSKDAHIAKLESAAQVNMDQYEKRYNMWTEEKSQLELKVKDLESDLAARVGVTEKQEANHAQAVAQMKKDLETEKKTVSKLKKEIETASTKTQDATKKLGICLEQLKEWEGNLSLLKELDFRVFDDRVKQLFNRCSKLARTHFLRDLPKEAFVDYLRWENLPKALDVVLCFPPTNSPAAKHMRMAAAMHTLSDRLCNSFFRPCYLPECSDAGDPMKEILGQLYTMNPKRERIMRSLLLSIYSLKEIEEAIKRAVQETSEEVCQLLSLIGGGEEAFRKDIKSFFHEAAKIWKEAQYSNKMVEASTDEDYENLEEWDKLDEFTSAAGEIKLHSTFPKFEMLNLFPCILVPETDHTVDRGCVLWPAQNTVFAAEQEMAQCSMRKPKQRKPSHGGGRRLSSQSDEASGLKSDERPAFLDAKQRAAVAAGGQAPNGKSGG